MLARILIPAVQKECEGFKNSKMTQRSMRSVKLVQISELHVLIMNLRCSLCNLFTARDLRLRGSD
ncbi:hypothetical protein HMPREF3152_05730 [Actinomyces sp. HMSC06A08]|uniref:Uncharacterized protein n=1 Tax=Winkia neuii TaxID=33007 RepID=A0A2I1IKL7_9ACTO|nr:hypothetical protein HMPREF3198_01960 [Winkia neuii]OFJ72740.1 hypothetical protein HMPREF2851_03410 [Actinomyces sp. HMSC064C12]OFK04904.1 hypothetical protein HMPREF2835_00430 [Actinomyces sp. HMSC072A03]OFT55210.1 hypothetical protein HMPREF3152_05730 [Actinomyces sp. HMSC06A08]PKY71666.1 hypothetical protein CYJ19_10655 [Winkia neuii]